jgi:dTDP-4-dehydrorhamnose reductase
MKAIVIGAQGTIGSVLTGALASRGDFVCQTTRRSAPPGRNTVHLDLASFDVNALRLPDADIAFFCAGITGFAACRTNETLARQVNVTGPTLLARRLVAAGTRVVLLSTSAVFDWRVPHMRESHPACPVTVYGRLKAEAEKAFYGFGPAASILRLTKVLTPDDNLFKRWIAALSQNQSVTAYSDHHMAPVTLDDAVAALLAISDSAESGVFQVSGARDINYYKAALHLASRLGADTKYVVEARARESGIFPEEIIQHSSLDTSRIAALAGWKAPDPHSVIDEVFRYRLAIVPGKRSPTADCL